MVYKDYELEVSINEDGSVRVAQPNAKGYDDIVLMSVSQVHKLSEWLSNHGEDEQG